MANNRYPQSMVQKESKCFIEVLENNAVNQFKPLTKDSVKIAIYSRIKSLVNDTDINNNNMQNKSDAMLHFRQANFINKIVVGIDAKFITQGNISTIHGRN